MRIERKHIYVEKYGKVKPVTFVNGIPFIYLTPRGNAINLRIGQSKQLEFIPKQYVDENGFLCDNISWWFNKPKLQHKIELYKQEMRFGEEL